MLPVAIVLLVIIVLFIVGVLASNPTPVTLNVFIAQIPTNLAVVFVVGAVTAFVAVGALALLVAGARRQRAISRAVKASPKSVTGSSTKDKGSTKTSTTKSSTTKSGTTKSDTTKSDTTKVKGSDKPSTTTSDTTPTKPDSAGESTTDVTR